MTHVHDIELQDAEVVEDDVEAVDGVPVLDDEPARLTPATAPGVALATVAASPVVVQAAAAAATGFVAGAATLALSRRRGARKLARAAARPRRGGDGLQVLSTRSFLIDVHLVDRNA